MKKYRSEIRHICENPPPNKMVRTDVIVWLGSSKYWTYVYLDKEYNRLFVRTAFGRFEALETFNVRKIEGTK